MKEKWIGRKTSVTEVIEIEGSDATIERLYSLPKDGPVWRTYVVYAVGVSTTWKGNGDFGAMRRVSLFYRNERGTVMTCRGTRVLREIPAWLYDLITRASPRDIDIPEPLAYNGRKFGEPEK